MNTIQSSVLYFANSSKSEDLEILTNNLDVLLTWKDTFTVFTMSPTLQMTTFYGGLPDFRSNLCMQGQQDFSKRFFWAFSKLIM